MSGIKSPYTEERKKLTDFYMWMVENEYDHNIRIRVETKAELYLREQDQANEEEKTPESALHIPVVRLSFLASWQSKIVTNNICPPIPKRDYDWEATREDYDEGDLIGTGRTEQDAIDDLVREENEA